MKDLRVKLNRQNLFYVIWTFYSSTYFLFWASNLKRSYSSVTRLLNVCTWITLAALVLYIMGSGVRKKDIWLYALLAGVTVLTQYVQRSATLVVLVLFVVSARRLDFREIIRYDVKLKLVWLGVIILLYVTGIVKNIEGYYGNIKYSVYKQALGFQHPNTLAIFTFTLVMEWLLLRFKSFRVWEWVAILVIWFVVMGISQSRSTGYSMLFLVFVLMLAKRFPKIIYSKPVRILFVAAPPVTAVLGIVLSSLYTRGNTFVRALNKQMTGRIYLQTLFLKGYSVNLFGNDIEPLAQYYTLDSAWIRCLLSYGLIFFIIFILLYMWVIYKAMISENIEMAVFSLFFVLMGFGETSMVRIAINVSMLAWINRGLLAEVPVQAARTASAFRKIRVQLRQPASPGRSR